MKLRLLSGAWIVQRYHPVAFNVHRNQYWAWQAWVSLWPMRCFTLFHLEGWIVRCLFLLSLTAINVSLCRYSIVPCFEFDFQYWIQVKSSGVWDVSKWHRHPLVDHFGPLKFRRIGALRLQVSYQSTKGCSISWCWPKPATPFSRQTILFFRVVKSATQIVILEPTSWLGFEMRTGPPEEQFLAPSSSTPLCRMFVGQRSVKTSCVLTIPVSLMSSLRTLVLLQINIWSPFLSNRT